MEEIKKLDAVALLVDVPQHNLRRGDVGTIVEVFEHTPHHPRGFIVEFVDEAGAVYAQLDVTNVTDIMPLRFNFGREAA